MQADACFYEADRAGLGTCWAGSLLFELQVNSCHWEALKTGCQHLRPSLSCGQQLLLALQLGRGIRLQAAIDRVCCLPGSMKPERRQLSILCFAIESGVDKLSLLDSTMLVSTLQIRPLSRASKLQ